jgi:ABC-2 type transport system permease protein
MGSNFAEAARQAFVVMKNEIKKYFSGKRMFVFLALLGIIVFVIVFAPYMFGGKANPVYFVMMSYLVVLMASTLFASISIVSEYEERTALIVFTRPIRKTSIFIGKALACIVVTLGFMALYYLIAVIVSAAVNGSVSGDVFTSFGLACAYAFGTIGIAMFVSSIMKKGSTATIITFVILAIIITAFSLVLNAANVDSSWMIDQASGSIETCSADYRDMTNKAIESLINALIDPSTFIHFDQFATNVDTYLHFSTTPEMLKYALVPNIDESAWDLSVLANSMGAMEVKEPDYLHDTIVMIVWGAVGMVAAFIAFLRREF